MANNNARATRRTQNNENMNTMDKTAIAAGVGSAVVSGAGGVTVSSCPPDDNSFYCKMTRWFNLFKMLIAFLAVLGVIYVLWVMFRGTSQNSKR